MLLYKVFHQPIIGYGCLLEFMDSSILLLEMHISRLVNKERKTSRSFTSWNDGSAFPLMQSETPSRIPGALGLRAIAHRKENEKEK